MEVQEVEKVIMELGNQEYWEKTAASFKLSN